MKGGSLRLFAPWPRCRPPRSAIEFRIMVALGRSSCFRGAGAFGGVLLLVACSSDARLAAIERRLDRIESASHASPLSSVQPPQQAPARIEDAFDKGWILVGDGADYYGVTRDPAIRREGRAPVVLAPTDQTFGKEATWTTSVDASPYRGKRIRVAIWTKTTDAGSVAFCARTEASDSPHRSVELTKRSIVLSETTGWEQRAIVVDVDAQADHIQFGIDLVSQRGDARVWVDDPKIEVVSADIPATPQFEGEKQLGDWLLTGQGAAGAVVDTSPEAGSIGVASPWPKSSEIHLVRAIPAEGLAGKNVRVSFDVRTKNDEGEAFCELFIQRSTDIRLAWKTSADIKELPGTSPGYTHCDLVAQVPEKSKWLIFGVRLEGSGAAWVKGGSLKISPTQPKSLSL
jgi:hypothetical protein